MEPIRDWSVYLSERFTRTSGILDRNAQERQRRAGKEAPAGAGIPTLARPFVDAAGLQNTLVLSGPNFGPAKAYAETVSDLEAAGCRHRNRDSLTRCTIYPFHLPPGCPT